MTTPVSPLSEPQFGRRCTRIDPLWECAELAGALPLRGAHSGTRSNKNTMLDLDRAVPKKWSPLSTGRVLCILSCLIIWSSWGASRLDSMLTFLFPDALPRFICVHPLWCGDHRHPRDPSEEMACLRLDCSLLQRLALTVANALTITLIPSARSRNGSEEADPDSRAPYCCPILADEGINSRP